MISLSIRGLDPPSLIRASAPGRQLRNSGARTLRGDSGALSSGPISDEFRPAYGVAPADIGGVEARWGLSGGWYGAGLGTCWILAGMDAGSSLVSVENDPQVLAIAREEIGADPRLILIEADGADFLTSCTERFDFIYADTWPGKYSHLNLALDLVKPGGIFLVDDMLPQPHWPAGHDAKVDELITRLEALPDFCVTKLGWSTGLILCVKG